MTRALDEARARLTSLSIQVGTAPATGPGVTMTLTDPAGGVGSEVILDLIQELRAAGAEAISIAGANGEPIRIGVNSWVSGRGGEIELDGTRIEQPYTVTAIGDPPTLAAALNIPGGVFDNVVRRAIAAGHDLRLATIESAPIRSTRKLIFCVRLSDGL